MKYWIIPSNSKKFNMEASLRANDGMLDWRVKNVSVGDIVFMYKTLPDACIKYMFEVVKTNIQATDRINQDMFWKDMKKFNHGIGVYSRFKLICALDDKRLNMQALKNHGINGTIQSKRECPTETLALILANRLE